MSRLRYLVGPSGFSDWPGLHDLLSDCFADMDGRIDPPSSLKQMTPADLCQKARGETLVVVLDGRAPVACGYLQEREGTIHLGKLAVRPTFRRRGILKAMVRIAETLAHERNLSALELQTRIELVENHETFSRLGFVKTAETCHQGYDRPTSITMTKHLR